MTRLSGLAALLCVAALAFAACSGSTATTAPTAAVPTAAPASAPASAPSQAAAACEPVDGATGTPAQIKGFAFPANITVKAGQAISWANGDSAPHTVTFDDGSCASGSIGAGSTVTVRYDVAGTFAFHCAIHPQMKGTLVVEG
jgi:plastocyanin